MRFRSLLTGLCFCMASTPATAQCPPALTQQVMNTNPESGVGLGWAVALSDDTMALISVPPGGNTTGTPWLAHIFDLDVNGVWNETTAITSPAGFAVYWFGLDLAMDGDTLFVADPTNATWEGDDDSIAVGIPYANGVVHVFTRNYGGHDNWGESQTLEPSDTQGLWFGGSVAADQGVLVVGSSFGGPAQQGAVFVYEQTTDGWQEVDTILAPAGSDLFGAEVAIEGGRIVVADPGWNSDRGRVLIYEQDTSSQWIEVDRITSQNPTGNAKKLFGQSVGCSGDTIVVGEPTWSGRGKVHIFERAPGGSWLYTANVAPTKKLSTKARFGADVAISGDALLVSQNGGSTPGVWAFMRDQGGADNWGQVLEHKPGGTTEMLALDGDRALIGSTAVSVNGVFVGAGFVYEGLGESQVSFPVNYCTAGFSAFGCRAMVTATGCPSATGGAGFVLSASGMEGGNDGIFYFGANGRQANAWGNGTSLQCVAPPVRRSALLSSSGTPGGCAGSIDYDLAAQWMQNPGQNPGAGALVQAQLWYRDPLNTSNQTTSLSDAIEFVVAP